MSWVTCHDLVVASRRPRGSLLRATCAHTINFVVFSRAGAQDLTLKSGRDVLWTCSVSQNGDRVVRAL